jgi:hypothetical protein
MKNLPKPVHPVISTTVVIGAVLLAVVLLLIVYAAQKPSSTVQLKATYSTPSPSNELSPSSTSMIASPRGTENWNIYISPDHSFGLRYPQDMKITGITPVANEKSNGVIFYKAGAYKENPVFEFSVIESGEDILNQANVLGRDVRLLSDLFNSSNGVLRDNLANGSKFPNERMIVTKIASLTINGYPAVYFTDVFTGSTQQPPDYANRYLIKTPNRFYLISQGFKDSKTKLDAYSNEFKLIVGTFTAF